MLREQLKPITKDVTDNEGEKMHKKHNAKKYIPEISK
jgi:hypothetical protein